jgi:hypothetical protein
MVAHSVDPILMVIQKTAPETINANERKQEQFYRLVLTGA